MPRGTHGTLTIPGHSSAFNVEGTWKSLFTRPGLPKQAAPPRNQRDFLSEREENHTLLTMLEISIHLVTGGLYFCFHAAESLASKQAGADGLCVLQQDTAPGALPSVQISVQKGVGFWHGVSCDNYRNPGRAQQGRDPSQSTITQCPSQKLHPCIFLSPPSTTSQRQAPCSRGTQEPRSVPV